MTTFSILFAAYGPDVERIAAELGIEPSSVDRLINEAMDEKYRVRQLKRAYQAKVRSQLREIREAHR